MILLFVLVHFLSESSMLAIECINNSRRWPLSKFWGFPKREELNFSTVTGRSDIASLVAEA